MTFVRGGSTSSGSTFSAGPSSSTSRSPSAEPSCSKQRRLTLDDIHIPAGFEIAKHLGQQGNDYPSEENIQKAAEVLQSLRGRMPDGSDGQVAACDYCRRRKIRCDRIKPTCGSCTSSGRKCTTEDMLRKRGPPSKKERAILEAAGIIFRGTRPHRRRRTATTSLGSGAASKQQEDLLRKVQEAAGTRTRANSTNSGENSAIAAAFTELEGESKSSWMEMLSIATQSSNPFADSPASSPSDISAHETFNVSAGACDFHIPGIAPVPARSAMANLHNTMPSTSAGWDNMWAPFGTQKHVSSAPTFGAGMDLPNLSAFACNANVDSKDNLFRSSPLASFDAGALDWSTSNLSPSQYQMLFPDPAPQHQHQQAHTGMPSVHVDPSIMDPNSSQTAQHDQAFLASQSTLAAEAMAFHNAMSHFFPKPLSSTASSAGSSAEVSTPAELDQFMSINSNTVQHPHQIQHQPLQFNLVFS